jgi:hypothetical protein
MTDYLQSLRDFRNEQEIIQYRWQEKELELDARLKYWEARAEKARRKMERFDRACFLFLLGIGIVNLVALVLEVLFGHAR